ncbi:MAG TPA: DNA-directed RNA polymerase subunit A'' [Candidatus Nanoarchaeia archaeon]|nr:DNA-directed RNA polymerase subunit A'' [Candidatus Nanoarchaeia archaeon]
MAKSIYEEYEEFMPRKLIDEAQEEIEKAKLKGKDVEKVMERIKEAYELARIDPGEAIGIITAESFGEPGTQMTLNVFHLAGVSGVQVTQGLPRLIELFDARKNPSTPRIEAFLTKEYSKDPDGARKIAALIKETKLGEIVDEFSLNLSQFRVEITLNPKRMKDLGITETQLFKILKDSLKNINIKEGKNSVILQPKTEQPEIQELYQLKEKSRDLYVKGVKGISQVLPIKKDNEFMIICVGNNLEDVIKVDGVDATRTIGNNIFEVYEVFGVEAARQTIIKEALEVIKSQGLDIDIRHIMLLADVMTFSGGVKGITRGGITGDKESILAKASFETPIKHIIEASMKGEKDSLNSVIENVMVNQEIPIGTGLPELIARIVQKK